MRRVLRSLVVPVLRSLGLDLRPHYAHWPDLWSRDARFAELMRQVRPRTLVPEDRCFFVYQLARGLNAASGDFAEVGVYRGGTAHLIAQAAPDKTLHLFDTFEGMPEVDAGLDGHRKGDFKDTSLDDVRRFLSPVATRVRFHPGFFPDTATDLDVPRFSFVYVDVDIYQSVLDALRYFYPRMTPGGAFLFDDFDSPKCAGVRAAIEEFLQDKPERPVVTTFHQAILIKQ